MYLGTLRVSNACAAQHPHHALYRYSQASATAWFAGRIVQFSLVTRTTQKRLPSGSSNTMKSSSGL